MVKSVPMRDHSVVIKPRRKSASGLLALLIVLLLIGVLATGVTFFVPARIALIQERMIGLLHGGIAASEERTFVDACVVVPGADTPQAVTRTVRTTSFADGTSLSVTFNSSPTPTNSQCG